VIPLEALPSPFVTIDERKLRGRGSVALIYKAEITSVTEKVVVKRVYAKDNLARLHREAALYSYLSTTAVKDNIPHYYGLWEPVDDRQWSPVVEEQQTNTLLFMEDIGKTLIQAGVTDLGFLTVEER
jgi:hypothetical protein